MSMPSGKTFDHGYGARSPEGMGYREIAEKMTESGDKMNHSTARNVLLRALGENCRAVGRRILC